MYLKPKYRDREVYLVSKTRTVSESKQSNIHATKYAKIIVLRKVECTPGTIDHIRACL